MSQTELEMLAAVAVLLIATAYLAVAEVGLTRLNRSRSEQLAESGHRSGRALHRLVNDPQSFLTPVRFLSVLCQLVQATLVGIVGDRLFGLTGLIVAVAIDVLVVFLLGESVPKTWAFLNPERAALLTARPISVFVRLAPARLAARALISLTNAVVPGKGLERGPFLTEEELLAIAQRGVDEGVIEADERQLIESIIEFGDTLVREVMVPRPDMVTVDASFRVADVMEVVLLNGYSRLPVRGEDIDDVVGLVYAKDLMRAERDGLEHERVETLLRTPHLVPETKRVPELLREMQREKFHMAIVVDEYGGTAGLVTLEDLIEELVGEIVDEFDVEDPLIEPLPGGSLRAHARTALDEVNDLLHAELPEGDWDSIGGLLYHELGRVPTEGESVEVDGWRLTAQRVQGRRIGRVQVDPLAPSPTDESSESAESADDGVGDATPEEGGPGAGGPDGGNGAPTDPSADAEEHDDPRTNPAAIPVVEALRPTAPPPSPPSPPPSPSSPSSSSSSSDAPDPPPPPSGATAGRSAAAHREAPEA